MGLTSSRQREAQNQGENRHHEHVAAEINEDRLLRGHLLTDERSVRRQDIGISYA